jgi:hypothetical protein
MIRSHAILLAIVLSACSVVVPKTFLIEKAAILSEVNSRTPIQFGLLKVELPIIDFVKVEQCISVQLRISSPLFTNGAALPVASCSRVRFDNASNSFFLLPNPERIDIAWSGVFATKPPSEQVEKLVKGAIAFATEKYPVYKIPKEKLTKFGYEITIDSVKIVDDGILVEVH